MTGRPGPKLEAFAGPQRARTLSLDDMTIDMAKALSGDENASRGIRMAIRFCYDLYQADRFTPGKTSALPVVPTLKVGPSPEPAEPSLARRGGSR